MSSIAPNTVSLVYCRENYGVTSPKIYCNFLNTSYYGFQFDDLNASTVWTGNHMCTHWAGLALTNSAVIGQQGSPAGASDNYWDALGSCAAWNTFLSQNETYSENSDPSLSPLYVFTAPGYEPMWNSSNAFTVPFYVSPISIFNGAPHDPLVQDCYISNPYPSVPSWRSTNNENLTSVNSNSDSGDLISVFPNPTSESLNVIFESPSAERTFRIIDLTGKTVSENILQNETNTIDVSGLKSSIYILEINSNNEQVHRFKLVKTN